MAAIPQPMDRLHDPGPPPFLTKTYDMVDHPTTDHIVSWSKGNNSFVVLDSQTFSMSLLPRYFKHNNFSSFIRQLNTYGFRKVDADRWEFANKGFLRGKKHLLKTITRRKSRHHQPQTTTNYSSRQSLEPSIEVGIFGLDREIDRLKRDKKILMVELIKLRQQQQTTRSHLQEMEQRLQRTEMKQQQMMSFLARAMKNPMFIQQKELKEVINNKRRRMIDQGNYEVGVGTSFVKVEPQYYEEIPEFESVDELETLVNGGRLSHDINSEELLEEEKEEDQRQGRGIKEGLEDCFWEGFLVKGMKRELV